MEFSDEEEKSTMLLRKRRRPQLRWAAIGLLYWEVQRRRTEKKWRTVY
jgi:hypothetical protein